MGVLAPLILNLEAKWSCMVSVSLLPLYSLGKSLSTMAKVTKVIDQNFIREEFENKLNGVMTIRLNSKCILFAIWKL
jgi:hypothetical protein